MQGGPGQGPLPVHAEGGEAGGPERQLDKAAWLVFLLEGEGPQFQPREDSRCDGLGHEGWWRPAATCAYGELRFLTVSWLSIPLMARRGLRSPLKLQWARSVCELGHLMPSLHVSLPSLRKGIQLAPASRGQVQECAQDTHS